MTAYLRRLGRGNSGHILAQCDDDACRDINGRPWRVMHPCRLVEGYDLAKRDRDDHNRSHHPERSAV